MGVTSVHVRVAWVCTRGRGVIKRGHALVQSVNCISVHCSTRAYQTACTDSAGCVALSSSHHSS